MRGCCLYTLRRKNKKGFSGKKPNIGKKERPERVKREYFFFRERRKEGGTFVDAYYQGRDRKCWEGVKGRESIHSMGGSAFVKPNNIEETERGGKREFFTRGKGRENRKWEWAFGGGKIREGRTECRGKGKWRRSHQKIRSSIIQGEGKRGAENVEKEGNQGKCALFDSVRKKIKTREGGGGGNSGQRAWVKERDNIRKRGVQERLGAGVFGTVFGKLLVETLSKGKLWLGSREVSGELILS